MIARLFTRDGAEITRIVVRHAGDGPPDVIDWRGAIYAIVSGSDPLSYRKATVARQGRVAVAARRLSAA